MYRTRSHRELLGGGNCIFVIKEGFQVPNSPPQPPDQVFGEKAHCPHQHSETGALPGVPTNKVLSPCFGACGMVWFRRVGVYPSLLRPSIEGMFYRDLGFYTVDVMVQCSQIFGNSLQPRLSSFRYQGTCLQKTSPIWPFSNNSSLGSVLICIVVISSWRRWKVY